MFSNFNPPLQQISEESAVNPHNHPPKQAFSLNNQYSSGKFSPTKSHNPCPICDDIKGKCRTVSEDFVLCMTHASDLGLLNWKFVGETTGSYFAGKYLRVRPETEAEQQQRRDTHLKQRIAQHKLQRSRLAKLPDTPQRDRVFTNYLQKLNLDEIDKADLLSRNLSESEIIRLEAKSTKSGYILPIKNPQQQILGFQIRLRDGSSGRYRWHKPWGMSAQQQNGELPLAFYSTFYSSFPDEAIKGQRVVLVEGTGVKPYLAAKLRNCPAIGASGGQFMASKQTLLTYLQDLGASSETTRLEYAIDAGDVANPSVLRRHEKNLNFIAELGFAIDVLWWGQLTKDADDIDELGDSSMIELLTVAQFWAIANYQPKPKFAPFQWFKDRLFPEQNPQPQVKALGFVRRSPQVSPSPINPSSSTLTYTSGTRLETWRDLLKSHKHLLDTSETGTGKSHDAGLLRPEMFNDIERIIYISNDSRNVTTETLQDWQLLPARHQGLTTKGNKLRRANYGDDLHTKSNCSRTGAIAALINKAVTDTSVICETCPLLNACRHSHGDGFGFRHERAIAFKSTILRSHPASLPSPVDYDYSKTLLVWEEVSESLATMRQIMVDQDDIDKAIAKISRSNLENPQQFIDVLNKLHHLLADKSRHGLDFHKIKATISDIVDSSGLADLFKPDLSILDTVEAIADSEFTNAKGQEKRELARLNSLLKHETTLQATEVERRIEREILKQWFCEFLDILSGAMQYGDLHIHKGKLTVSILNPRLRDITSHSAANLYLDATISPHDLEMRIKAQIHPVKQSTNFAKPNIYQVTDIGRMTMQRGNEQTRQAQAIIDHLKQTEPSTKVIDFKKFKDYADGAWFRDSRGSNDFIEAKNLVIVGTPCPNIAALKAEYVVLTGSHPLEKDADFANFVDRQILANVQQCFGRKSGQRFHEGDKIYFLSNFDLGDIPHTQIKAAAITPEAMSKVEILRQKVKEQIQQAVAEGFDLLFVGQRQMAQWLGLERGTYLYHADWINSLLSSLYSKLIQNFSENAPPNLADTLSAEELSQIEFWAGASERLLVDLVPVRDLLGGIFEFFDRHIPRHLHIYVLDRLSLKAKNVLFSSLALVTLG
ncbi:hypothetical protein H6F42_00100 [Pseudanabaena sp. FACHB-1998]|uniref:hypothetical protein n=1 Tax=Pseudanabaena sp. FACHB-1998 TaxID=2692858 RepID=UPI001680C103|nr:hypothetical protein [Pseudanabaena sp. FACHB-1998]MBD2175316.1 hypothetical protein [Pseudanabaena sp. FACHB-1998]